MLIQLCRFALLLAGMGIACAADRDGNYPGAVDDSRLISTLISNALATVTNPAVAPSLNRKGTSPAPSAGPATAVTAGVATNSLDDKLKLGVGDRLSYRVVEDREDAKPLVVTDSGDVDVPLIGRVAAVGKTCRSLAAEIKAKLDTEYYFNATVVLAIDVFSRTRGKVYLVGYVRVPGPLDIPSDELFTLSKAIMRAGGFSEYADKKKVRVTRKGPDADSPGQNLEVDVGAVLEDGRSEKDLKLEVGDLIYVPSRLFKF